MQRKLIALAVAGLADPYLFLHKPITPVVSPELTWQEPKSGKHSVKPWGKKARRKMLGRKGGAA